jgi:AraC family transcriptional regulator, arabinose operon regulatory protein
MSTIRMRDGFKNEILYVLPQMIVGSTQRHPLLHSLMPTDIGWFPEARYHYCERENGAREHILIVCTEGRGWYRMDNTLGEIGPHEALLVPRGMPHAYGSANDDPWSIYFVHLMGTDADYLMEHLLRRKYTLKVAPDTLDLLERDFRRCFELFPGGFVLQRLVYVSQILHHLLGCLLFNNRAFSPTLGAGSFHDLQATIDYLQQHIDSQLTLTDMARHFNLGVSHFSHLFKQQTGYSPIDYFIHLKMQHACTLLSLTRQTVEEVGVAVGYTDPYYFSRIFRKIIGVSPAHYRKNVVENRQVYPLTKDSAIR